MLFMSNISQFFPPWAAIPKYRGELEVHKVCLIVWFLREGLGGCFVLFFVFCFFLILFFCFVFCFLFFDSLGLGGESFGDFGCFFEESLFVWSGSEFYG